jgi:hypothetical protein
MGLKNLLLQPLAQVQESWVRTSTRKRAARLGTHDIMDWAEAAVSGIGRSMLDFQRGITVDQGGIDPLEEALMGAEALVTMIEELVTRRDQQRL